MSLSHICTQVELLALSKSVRALAHGGSADATIEVVLGTPAEVRLAL